MYKLSNKLPDTLSGLILRAIDDMILVSRSSKYDFSLGVWHSYNEERNACSVCFAGAIMAAGLPDLDHITMNEMTFGHQSSNKFEALNEIRHGTSRLTAALWNMYNYLPSDEDNIIENAPHVDNYIGECLQEKRVRRKFYRQMRKLAAYLESKGL